MFCAREEGAPAGDREEGKTGLWIRDGQVGGYSRGGERGQIFPLVSCCVDGDTVRRVLESFTVDQETIQPVVSQHDVLSEPRPERD